MISVDLEQSANRYSEALKGRVGEPIASLVNQNNKAEYLDDKCAALNAFAEHVARIIEDNQQ